MNYKSFRVNIIVRIALLALTILALVLLLQNDFPANALGCSLALLFQAWQLLAYIEKTHRELNHFFAAMLTDDFTRSPSGKPTSHSGQELRDQFSKIQLQFQTLRHKHEELTRYYSLLLEKVPVAILIVDGESLTLANAAAQKLFQRNHLDNIHSLQQFGEQLALDIQQILPGEKRTSQIILHSATTSLVLSAASIQLSETSKKIISLNPIQRELDKQEITAWQHLVQVFTHEIMNSMTPVTSLSNTAAGLLENIDAHPDAAIAESIADAHQAIAIVARRAQHLLGFVEAYRRIANPVRIQSSEIQLQPLFSEICQLFSAQAKASNIALSWQVTPANLSLNADQAQIEQVLINLLKNSLEAIDPSLQGEIQLHAYIGAGGNLIIDVADNGCGIPSDKAEHIFVPFYTSKREGTGIGLFLVKQIMQAHLGSVYATRSARGGALFRLLF